MQTIRISTFLRRVFFADAATCIAMALLLTLGSGMLGDFLNIPAQVLFYAGLSLFTVRRISRVSRQARKCCVAACLDGHCPQRALGI